MMKYFSLFSGIGGFEQGIIKSGVPMESVGYSEVDKYAESIYSRHFPKVKGYGDATQIKTEEVPEFDLLVGGFPCQAFSIAGKRKGFSDTRGTLFFEIARFLADKQPKYFLLENVYGLLSHENGNTFKRILGVFSELGYDCEWQCLNSKDFGLPQNRERVFFKGYSREKCAGEILSQKRDCREIIAQMKWEWTSTRVAKYVDKDGLALTLCSDGHNSGHNQLIKCNEKSQGQTIYDSEGIASTLVGNGGGHGGKTGLYVERIGNVSNTGHCGDDVLDENGLSTSLTSTNYKHPLKIRTNVKKGYDEAEPSDGVRLCHPSSKTSRGRVHKEETGALSSNTDWGTIDEDYRIRRLTPVECERLQGFEDNYTKWGKDGEEISDTQRYKCLGNAVSVNVVEFLIRSMFDNDITDT